MAATCEDLQKDGENQLALARTIHLAKTSTFKGNQEKNQAAGRITITQSLRELYVEQSLNFSLRDIKISYC